MRSRFPFAAAVLILAVLAQPGTSGTASAQDAGGGGLGSGSGGGPGGGPGGGMGGGGPGGGGFGGGGPGAAADAGGGAKGRLDRVLSVLRDHQSAAGKQCLQAMTEVHQTEDQVASLGQQDSNSNRSDNGADIARDVLESDYDTAQSACQPDADRVCHASPNDQNCLKLNGGGPPH